jgi:hypothetical protein
VFAAMAMQWTVARAVGSGVLKERLPFLRTAKGGATPKGDFPAFWEAVIAALLLILVVTNYKQVHEINIFAAVLVVQSLPFLSAVAIALIEGTRAQLIRVLAPDRGQDRRAPAALAGHRRAAEGSRREPRGSGAVAVGVSPRVRSPPIAPSRRCRPGSPRR